METDYKIEIIDYEGAQLLGIRETVSFDKLPEFFERNYTKLMQHLQANGLECTSMPVAVYYGWDMDKNETSVAAALPVNKVITDDTIEGINIPPRKAYITDYFGPYDKMMPAYMALMAQMEKDNVEMDLPCLELYMNDPVAEPDPTKWHTRIVIFYKK